MHHTRKWRKSAQRRENLRIKRKDTGIDGSSVKDRVHQCCQFIKVPVRLCVCMSEPVIFMRGAVKGSSAHARFLHQPCGRVVSVATLPMMVSRLGWGSRFKSDPRLNAAGSLVKPSGSLESGRMGNISPATEPPWRYFYACQSDYDLWRQHGGPAQTLSRMFWEVKQDPIMGRSPSLSFFITIIDFVEWRSITASVC